MMRTLATMLTLALALPLAAEEAKKSAEKPKPGATAATAPAPPAPQDSPLVAAAKRSNRLGKKPASKVITNETLKSSGANAHVTTTERQQSLDPVLKMKPAEPTPEMAALKQAEERRKAVEKEAAEKQKADKEKAEQQRAQNIRRQSQPVGEEYPEGIDPEMSEDSNPEHVVPPPDPPPPSL